ncbi:hypothetical protein [Thiocapsa sp.]|uniref:hypothetical protein n=1 Tax=Thiocapsa sp. TaxID=2024551 RepID=UPI003593AAC9
MANPESIDGKIPTGSRPSPIGNGGRHPLGPERCRVTFEIPRRAPFYRLVCDAALRRIEERARTRASLRACLIERSIFAVEPWAADAVDSQRSP